MSDVREDLEYLSKEYEDGDYVDISAQNYFQDALDEIERLRELQSIVCEVVFNERHGDTLGMRKLCAWVHKNVVIGGEDE